jgi:hypothetical protein
MRFPWRSSTNPSLALTVALNPLKPSRISMASKMPIPQPPRTPTPPPDDFPEQNIVSSQAAFNSHEFLPTMVSTKQPSELAAHGDLNMLSPTSPATGSFTEDIMHNGTSGPAQPNPFNFQPTVLAKSSGMKSVCFLGRVYDARYRTDGDV